MKFVLPKAPLARNFVISLLILEHKVCSSPIVQGTEVLFDDFLILFENVRCLSKNLWFFLESKFLPLIGGGFA